MATTRHTIEFNGQLYDAVTGEVLKTKAKSNPGTRVMDGFTKRKAVDQPALAPVEPAAPARKHRVSVQSVKPAPKPAKKSRALMRAAVRKPAASAAPEPKSAIKKTSVASQQRLQRASTSLKSDKISKFGQVSRPAIAAQVAPLAVQSAPSPSAPPLSDLRQQIAAVTAPVTGALHSFESALHRADSHNQPKLKKAKLSHRLAAKAHVAPRQLGAGSGLAAALILASFFLYQNAAHLSMRVAATKAGVAASLPAYKPSGFSLSRKIQYSPGEITLSFKSNSDERAFDLTQKKTALSPQQLEEELANRSKTAPLTYQDKDKTIFIYDGSNAAWINKGVLYQIEGDSALNSDQLLRVATSI